MLKQSDHIVSINELYIVQFGITPSFYRSRYAGPTRVNVYRHAGKLHHTVPLIKSGRSDVIVFAIFGTTTDYDFVQEQKDKFIEEARIMQKLGFQVTSFTRKSRRYNSYKGNVGKIAPNRINRHFYTSVPHQKITTDTTEFKYYEIDNKGRMVIKKLYLDPFLDMFNGEVLSYSISQNPSAIGILSAQRQAIEITSDCPYRRTFHSDRGWAYQMGAYSSALKENKIFQSMSRKGNCYDNSVMENFFGILKQEMYYGTTYYSFDELKEAIERYIKYYNEKRIKEKLGWMSPVQYRLNTLAA